MISLFSPTEVDSVGIELERDRTLVLFDLAVYGHHPNYIRHLLHHWSQSTVPGNLKIVVVPQFVQVHADLVQLSLENAGRNIQFVTITPQEEAALKSKQSKVSRHFRRFQEWRLFAKYAKQLKATNALILYLDIFFLPLALGASFPCPFSGIYFRPTFHYYHLTTGSSKLSNRLQDWRERIILKRVLQHTKLRTLLCLDPFAISPINQLNSPPKAIHLPDPVQVVTASVSASDLSNLRHRLQVEGDRHIFLLFGSLNGRKGVDQTLQAIALLSPSLRSKISLLLVGAIDSADQERIQQQITELRQTQTVQIIENYQFVPEQEVQTYFQLADVVLAPYQRHVGMSGILLLAAAAQRPILGSNYGLMGEIIHQYEMGLAVDSTNPQQLAEGMAKFLTATQPLHNLHKMEQLVQQNSAEKFASTILQYV